MTDHRTRSASREALTVEEQAEELLRRQRAGLIRDVDVGPCTWCKGAKSDWCSTNGEAFRLSTCLECNGTGRRTRSGLELAAYCGHEAARLALGHEGLLRVEADATEGFWRGLVASFGPKLFNDAASARNAPHGEPDDGKAKAALIRWALTEPD